MYQLQALWLVDDDWGLLRFFLGNVLVVVLFNLGDRVLISLLCNLMLSRFIVMKFMLIGTNLSDVFCLELSDNSCTNVSDVFC